MKKYFLIAIMFSLLFVSCDVIEPPYTVNGNGIDTSTSPVKQKVLVEYFTGHRCPNCPTESYKLKLLMQQYGDRLIVISVHAGSFAEPLSTGNYTSDFRTVTGNELDATFGVTAISTPNALVNRTDYEGNIVLSPASWAGAISVQMLKPPSAGLFLQPEIQGNIIHLNAGIKPLKNIEGTYMISAYIVEDSIVSYQKNNNPEIGTTPEIANYVHRYMLRGSMNGTFGDTIFSPQALTTDSFAVQYTTALNPSWNTQKLYVVCFIYNKETDEVLQTERKKLQ